MSVFMVAEYATCFSPSLKHLKFGIPPQTKVPLRELWDLAPDAKGPGRSLTYLCNG